MVWKNFMYSPLNLHTHYSLLRGFSRPTEVAKRMAELNIGSAALTDFDTLSGTVNFFKSMNDVGIKPIIGTKVLITNLDGVSGYVTLMARNLDGWREIVQLSSLSYTIGSTPSVSFSDIEHLKNVIVLCGEPESLFTNAIVSRKIAYVNSNPSNYESYFTHTDYKAKVKSLAERFKKAFGDRFFIAIQRVNQKICPIDGIVADVLTDISKSLQVNRVGVPNTFYNKKEEVNLHRLVLCSHAGKGWNAMQTAIESEELASHARFMRDDRCHTLSYEDMKQIYTEEEIKNSLLISDMCDKFSILANPTIPQFKCPQNLSEKDYLLQLCRTGWSRLKNKLDSTKTSEYVSRVNNELGVFNEVGLEGYFLIMQDIVNWAKAQGMLVGCSRGSAGGCLVSYLIGITSIDPVIYDLYFERFYNKGRNSPGKVSFPDIDVDFPIAGREKVIQYIRDTYRSENVAQVATFSRLQGRGAVREVMRVHQACDKDTIDSICKYIPQEAEIADKLEEAKETSIIRWTLRNEPEDLRNWVQIDDDDNLTGDMAQYFQEAIAIEGTFKSYGKHASAVIISNSPIASVCPMIRDKKTGIPITGIEFEELESLGLVKFDILGTTILDKLMGVNQILKTGTLEYIEVEQEEEHEE